MLKKHTYFILFVPIFLFFLSFGYCFALEVQTPQGKSGYPSFPFVPQITEQSTLPNYFVYYFGAAMYIAGILALVMLAIAGIQLIASTGNPERISEAKKRATSAILGLVLLFASFIIINTINPRLTNLEPSEPLKQVGGPLLSGPAGTIPALMMVGDISAIIQKYTKISWPEFTKDSAGKQIRNCDPTKDYPYFIYFYQDKNFQKIKKVDGWTSLTCGHYIDISGANSYLMKQLTPGVYFYQTDNCTPAADSNEMPLVAYTQSFSSASLPNIKSVYIVNGDDPFSGPFFGAILFPFSNYQGFGYVPMHFVETAGSFRCIQFRPVWQNIASIVIYKWVGRDKNGYVLSAGPGVTLYTKPNYTGGSYTIPSLNIQEMFLLKPLADLFVDYANTNVPEDEREKCEFFHVPGTAYVGYDYYCLQSIKIDGNYLVILDAGYTALPNIFKVRAEAFPQGTQPNGPPDLNLEDITAGRAKRIEIIPLAEPFQ